MCLFLGICSTSWFPESHAQAQGITPVYEWSQLEFEYESDTARQAAIDAGDFLEGHPAPIDVDVYYSGHDKNKIFITIPRFQAGVPATLGTLTEKTRNGNPVIAPFPSWSWHQNPSACAADRIVSVYRVKVDECGRVWVLDTGRLVDQRICPAQILAFDILTHDLLHRYEIPDSQLQSNSILVTPIVDVRDPHMKCKNTFVYVADCQAMSLIVYDVKRQTSWHINDKTMYPYPNYGTYRIAGQQFELMDGILGMDLSPYKPGEDRVLFFHAMSSPTENWVYTSDIRNESLFLSDPSAAPQIFHTYPGMRNTQCPAQAIDKDGISYFGLATDTSINCWNTATDYGERNLGVLSQNQQTLQFPSGVKVITNRRGSQELWFITMRFQRIATGTLDTNEVNFRIQAAKIEDITRGSKCLNKPPGTNNANSGSSTTGSGGHHHRPSYGGGYGYAKNSNNKRETDRSVHFPDN